jgi:hypothetical protein
MLYSYSAIRKKISSRFCIRIKQALPYGTNDWRKISSSGQAEQMKIVLS